jgi:DNA-binding LacI/PurR family transcriptional regulator
MKKKKILEYPTKHGQLTAILKESLKKDKFPGNKFYTVRRLMDEFKVSQATVSKALDPLFAEGLIYGVSGKGIFVIPGSDKEEAGLPSSPTLNYIISNSDMFSPASNPTDWFICKDIMEGVTSSAFAMGYRVNIVPMRGSAAELRHFDETIRVATSDALFVFYSYVLYEPLIQSCIDKGKAYSLYAGEMPIKRKINQVWGDMENAAFRNTERLIALGHKNIAFLGGCKNSPRYKGHLRALREAGIKKDNKYDQLLGVAGAMERAREAVYEFLKKHPEVTAIASFSDLRALGAMAAAKDMGLEVPRDLSIVGIDDISWLYPATPVLSTAHFPGKEIGRELVKLADDSRKKLAPRTARLELEAIEGASCAELR